MIETNLKDLVIAAKGERSLRQYAKDSGVDVAIISKIINGKYTPKDSDIYRKLTSEEASPRNNIKALDLIEAADYSRAYKTGVKIGAMSGGFATVALTLVNPALGAMAATAVGVMKASEEMKKSKKDQKSNDKIDQMYRKSRQFIAVANEMIFERLSENGIVYQPIASDEENVIDRKISLNNGIYEQYTLRYLYALEEEKNNEKLIKNTVKRAIEVLIFMKPLKKRKVSYVVNCKELYECMCEYKDKLSYASDLSVIYVDQTTMEIMEECICKQEEISDETVIKMI